MFRFTIRDVLWLTAMVALALVLTGVGHENRRLRAENDLLLQSIDNSGFVPGLIYRGVPLLRRKLAEPNPQPPLSAAGSRGGGVSSSRGDLDRQFMLASWIDSKPRCSPVSSFQTRKCAQSDCQLAGSRPSLLSRLIASFGESASTASISSSGGAGSETFPER